MQKAKPQIAILGAGFSGIGVAIELKKAGIDSFTIYEKGDGVGGCWRYTTYPGVACDVPSHLYCFSYEPNPNWSRVYSPGHEIRAYIEACAEKYDLMRHLQPNVEIATIKFIDKKWQMRDKKGNLYVADIVIPALGPLHTPKYPDIKGISDFAGVSFHSARWNHSHDLQGKRVAVIGNGSSGVQIIPEVAKVADHVTVFSRTPGWVMPRRDRAYTEEEKSRFRRFPILMRFLYELLFWDWESRYGYLKKNSWRNSYYSKKILSYMQASIKSPEIRDAIIPDYSLGCKRLIVSSDYLPALQRPNVTLVTQSIDHVCQDGAVTNDSVKHNFDTLILATGYKAFDISKVIDIVGPEGVELKKVWGTRYVTHRTTAIPGFPNLFIMLGPNTGLGYSSMTVVIEAQAKYIARCIEELIRSGANIMMPRQEPAEKLYRYIQDSLGKTVLSESCRAWYKDENGKVHSIWPNRTLEYRRLLKKPKLDEFELK
ncbi:MAG: NAD(P)/FAD-dependent oxidoreductase [Blastocatellia bacterium]|nr:NAD(P)/FAD-dependent oxidoreductase [Blastocatellia bacterium]